MDGPFKDNKEQVEKDGVRINQFVFNKIFSKSTCPIGIVNSMLPKKVGRTKTLSKPPKESRVSRMQLNGVLN